LKKATTYEAARTGRRSRYRTGAWNQRMTTVRTRVSQQK
jgi:hypothetical protein